ncbi:hypothetical protein BH11ARM1_BH11ARM1_18380 [soil metagenome]
MQGAESLGQPAKIVKKRARLPNIYLVWVGKDTFLGITVTAKSEIFVASKFKTCPNSPRKLYLTFLPFKPMQTDTSPSAQAMQSTENGLFFIVGCGRSGTTLLQVMLDSHSDIALPNETHFYSVFFRRKKGKYGQMDSPELLESALDEVMQIDHFRAFGVEKAQVLAYAQSQKPSWETLFLALMTAFRVSRNVQKVGKKTPSHLGYLWDLYTKFPDAKFIHVIRDPRAVLLSYLKAPFYKNFGKNPFHAMNAWRNAADIHFDAVGRIDPKRYTTVRYEDLVSKPKEELERLCGFLEVPFQESMLEYHKRSYSGFLEAETHKLGTLQPVYTGSLDKWKEQLSPQNIELLEAFAGDRMTKLGYEITAKPTPKLNAQLKFLFLSYKTRVRFRRLKQMVGLAPVSDLGGVAEAKES